MQKMLGVILLPILLSVSSSFQPAAGIDCENTCATCYQQLATRLIDTGNNKYDLFKGFFPPHAAPPVLVKVTYSFIDCNDSCADQTWYWTEGTFYIYQPLEVFVFRSLFFSPISLRQGRVHLQLPAECIDAPFEFFEMLTQKLKAYAMFQTATPRVDNTYVAKAVNGDKKLDYKNDDVFGYTQGIHLDGLLYAYQCGPYVITFGIVIAIVFFLCFLFCTCENPRKRISQKVEDATKKSEHQATVVATVTLCSCFTVYNFVLDMISAGADDNHDLPSYYNKNNGIYNYTIVFAFFSLLSLIIGMVCFIVLLCMWCCGPCSCCGPCGPCSCCGPCGPCSCCCQDYNNTFAKGDENQDKKSKELAKEKQHLALLIPIVFCVGSVVLSLSFHFQNILIAWSTDPLYASRIAVYYGIVIFVYYLTFKNTYMLPNICKKVLKESPANDRSQTSPTDTESKEEKRMKTIRNGIPCVVIAGILLSGFHVLNAMFIYYIPINHSIEESVSGVQTIYNGAVVLIGALVAYNIGWFYFHSKKFSVKAALEKAMKDLNEYPFGRNPIQDVEAGWGDLSAQDRMTKVMRGLLIHKGNKYRAIDTNTRRSTS